MLSPFPGMDPYLEQPELWSEVHSRLIVNLADYLGPQLRPKYRVAVEKRTYTNMTESALVGLPDLAILSNKGNRENLTPVTTMVRQEELVTIKLPMPEEVKESYLEIREIATGAVVTTIEILSPKNKRSGVGRDKYQQKRIKVLGSLTHLVEIDLLRSGKSMAIPPDTSDTPDRLLKNYNILVSRSHQRPLADLYLFGIRQQIPSFPLPLLLPNEEIFVDLQELLAQVYEKASFDLAVDYTQATVPPLKGDDAVWADNLLRKQGLR